MGRGLAGFAAVLVVAVAGCRETRLHGPPLDDELPRLKRVDAGRATVYWRAEEIEAFAPDASAVASPSIQEIARVFDATRGEVQKLLRLEPPSVEVRLYLDRSIGQERYHVTQASLVQDGASLRVIVPIFMAGDDTPASFLDRARGTIAHEVTEASVITHVTRFSMLDPYLRWMHDGIAVYAEHAIDVDMAPDDAVRKLEKTLDELEKTQRLRHVRWLDLTRWRQFPDFIIHSDKITDDQENVSLERPLERALGPVAKAKNAEASDVVVRIYEAVARLVADAWRKESMPFGDGEAAPARSREESSLFYHASFAFWLEAERAHPGLIRRVLEKLSKPNALPIPIVTGDEVARLIGQEMNGDDVRPRLLRYRIDRIERVLRDEIGRLKSRSKR